MNDISKQFSHFFLMCNNYGHMQHFALKLTVNNDDIVMSHRPMEENLSGAFVIRAGVRGRGIDASETIHYDNDKKEI